MSTFEVGGNSYRVGKMNAIKQIHVVRRLAPLVAAIKGSDLQDISGAASQPEDRGKDLIEGVVGKLLAPLLTAVAGISDADTEYVLAACLGACERAVPHGLGWSPVWNAEANRPQFDDISMMVMFQLVGKVLAVNLSDFTDALRLTVSGPAPAPR